MPISILTDIYLVTGYKENIISYSFYSLKLFIVINIYGYFIAIYLNIVEEFTVQLDRSKERIDFTIIRSYFLCLKQDLHLKKNSVLRYLQLKHYPIFAFIVIQN